MGRNHQPVYSRRTLKNVVKCFPEPSYDHWTDSWKFDKEEIDSISLEICAKLGLDLHRIEMEQIIEILIERGYIKQSENDYR